MLVLIYSVAFFMGLALVVISRLARRRRSIEYDEIHRELKLRESFVRELESCNPGLSATGTPSSRAEATTAYVQANLEDFAHTRLELLAADLFVSERMGQGLAKVRYLNRWGAVADLSGPEVARSYEYYIVSEMLRARTGSRWGGLDVSQAAQKFPTSTERQASVNVWELLSRKSEMAYGRVH